MVALPARKIDISGMNSSDRINKGNKGRKNESTTNHSTF
jgi:hypothetical protein